MAREIGFWKKVGNALLPVFTGGVDILVSGTDRHVNFKDQAGSAGYGIRDSSGEMQVKNESEDWRPIGDVRGNGIRITVSDTAPTSPNVNDLWIDTSGV